MDLNMGPLDWESSILTTTSLLHEWTTALLVFFLWYISKTFGKLVINVYI